MWASSFHELMWSIKGSGARGVSLLTLQIDTATGQATSPQGAALHSHCDEHEGLEAEQSLHRQPGASGQQAKIGDDPHLQAVLRDPR